MKVAFYALGGGVGHLCRSLAVARRLVSSPGNHALMLVPGRLREWVDEPLVCRTPPGPSREELGRWIQAQLDDYQPDLLVMDLFPLGVFGEMPSGLSLPKVLLTRWVGSSLYQEPETLEVLREFRAIFSSEPFQGGEDSELESKFFRVDPVTWTQGQGSRLDARTTLGGGERPLLVALGAGSPRAQTLLQGRLESLSQRQGWDLRFYSPILENGLKGVGRWLHGADLVVGAAGYQTFYEVLQSGVPGVFLPQRSPHDNQSLRATGRLWTGSQPLPVRAPLAAARTPEEMERAVTDLMKKPPAEPIAFEGARQVAGHLIAMMK